MKQKIDTFLKKVCLVLRIELVDDTPFYVKDQYRENLLARIKAIRNESGYVPNYNKPNLHTRTTQQRPKEFENNMGAWAEAVRKEVQSLDKNRLLREEAVKQEREEIRINTQKVMRNFMIVN